ncbi:MAG: Rieske 2Fe-2S domain-containing protein [Chloroflexi bacterium]|nr:Rieske 2Fe-2S domain-containing protein [Chloroflexota bacterium]
MVSRLHFNHKVVQISNLERSERFFGEVLGLEAVGRDLWPGEEGRTSTFKTQIGQYVVLVEVLFVDASRAEHWNFMLSPEDFVEVQARLKVEGCAIGDLREEFRAVGEMSDNYYDPDDQMMQITAIAPEAYETPPARRGKIVAGRLEDFPLGSVTHNDVGRFFIVRTQDGILAISEVCTHRQSSVCYQPEHFRFYCPRHHNKFTRTGVHLGHTPGTPPLHVHAIEFVDGQVVVDTDVSIRRLPSEAKRMAPVRGEAGATAPDARHE